MLTEFFSTVERARLKGHYGEGFAGAPLRTFRVAPRATGGVESSDEYAAAPDKRPARGGNRV